MSVKNGESVHAVEEEEAELRNGNWGEGMRNFEAVHRIGIPNVRSCNFQSHCCSVVAFSADVEANIANGHGAEHRDDDNKQAGNDGELGRSEDNRSWSRRLLNGRGLGGSMFSSSSKKERRPMKRSATVSGLKSTPVTETITVKVQKGGRCLPQCSGFAGETT